MPGQATVIEKDYVVRNGEFEGIDFKLRSQIIAEVDRTINNQNEAINPSFCDWSHVETKILPKLETSLSTSSKIGVIRPSHQSGRRVSSSGCSTSKASKAATSTNKPSSRSSQNQEPSFQMKQNGNFEVNAELFSSPIDCRNFIKEYRERKLIKLREKVGEIAYVNWGLDLKLAKSDTFV